MKLDQLLQRRRGRVPRPSKLTFIAVSILVCLYLLYGLAKTRRRATTYGVGPEHPVEALHKAASTRFTDMMARQSGSPEEAAKEYVRRYARQPPPGFEDWVSYTIARDSPVIDDFDLIMEGLGPFWKLTATEIKDLMKRATDGQVDHIWMCSFVSGKFTRKECEVYTDLFNDWMGDTKATLPDFEIPINFLDEPSVLPDELRDESRGSLNALRWSEKAHTSIRQEVAAACKIRGPPSRSHSHRYFDHVRTHGIPFVLYPEAEKDLCANPELGDGHGLILSPVSMWQMHYPIPLFSPAAPRPFLDILFPSSWYDLTGYFYEEDKDTVWSSKRNVLYWAGSSTGSYGHDDASWRHSHRQRLAALVMGADPTRSFAYLDSSLGSLRSYHSRALNASHYDVHITTIRHCDDPICDIEKTYFLPPSDDDRPADDAAYDARFVFDIDGNSYSGRFYRLLESHGCVLKSTMFREWHDERLIPWLHYVPVSQGLEELPELMRFLVETKAGQEVGRRVAEAGRNWTRRALRPVDRGVYLYRLFLETTWLLNPTRVPG